MSLLALQRDFRQWLDIESAEAAARIGEHAAPGLSVYLNNYRSALMACLAESFGSVKAWIGDDAFEGAAATHIERQPPYSWTLDDYALEFPETLDAIYVADPEIGELARLERELGRIFVGKNADPLDVATFADIDWESAKIDFVPTLTMIEVTTNAASIWSSLAEDKRPPDAEMLPRPASVAIWRVAFMPTFRTIEDSERQAIEALAGGATFSALCATFVEAHGETEGAALAGRLLSQWIADGLIAHIRAQSFQPDNRAARTCKNDYRVAE